VAVPDADAPATSTIAAGATTAEAATLLASYRILWRTHSGTAHGYVWPAMLRIRAVEHLPNGGALAKITISDEEMPRQPEQ
jgi:hypothetical protein